MRPFDKQLRETVRRLCNANEHGILAADESTGTIGNRLASIGLENTLQNRYAYRELLLTTPGLVRNLCGMILYDETLFAKKPDGTPLIDESVQSSLVIGIKSDRGLYNASESSLGKFTDGLKDLRERSIKYYRAGARFAKWRSVFYPNQNDPRIMKYNCQTLAKYAKISQETGLVPIVEPEVLMDFDNTIEKCQQVTQNVLACLFAELLKENVPLEYVILKTNFVYPGKHSDQFATISTTKAACLTLETLKRTVPIAVPGVFFLSGGLSEQKASDLLRAINDLDTNGCLWRMSFSYGRALQGSVLAKWKGLAENKQTAQQQLLENAARNGKASKTMLRSRYVE